MRYKILVFGIIFFACILALMEFNTSFQAKILNVSDYIKIFFLDSKESIKKAYETYFNQAEEIADLRAKVADYDKILLEKNALENDVIKLSELVSRGGITQASSEIHKARVISFSTFGDRSKVWLDADLKTFSQSDKLEDRIFGIVKDNVAFGVAVVENGRLEGFLNGSKDCHYDVYIGKNKIMGIVSASNKGRVIVDYIPDWAEIRKGDKVFTSGLDGIFFENIPVGVVENVQEHYGYLRADITPYANISDVSYVWIIDREAPHFVNEMGNLPEQ